MNTLKDQFLALIRKKQIELYGKPKETLQEQIQGLSNPIMRKRFQSLEIKYKNIKNEIDNVNETADMFQEYLNRMKKNSVVLMKEHGPRGQTKQSNQPRAKTSIAVELLAESRGTYSNVENVSSVQWTTPSEEQDIRPTDPMQPPFESVNLSKTTAPFFTKRIQKLSDRSGDIRDICVYFTQRKQTNNKLEPIHPMVRQQA